jgi:tetratricopeptide (TPR) repeat protein
MACFALALVASAASAFSFQEERDEPKPGMRFTDEEYMTLPRYCLAQNGIANKLAVRVVPEEEVKNWYAMMGDSFNHVHHYCMGLMLVRRGNAATKSMDRNAFYKSAIENFNYSIRRSDDAFPLKPEIYLRKGMTFRLLGREGAASSEFHRAIALKADYSPAYSALADLLIDLGQRQEALEVLETGLRHAPDSKVLSSKKAELTSLQPGSR